VNSNGRTIGIADAHRGDGKRFIARADEKLSAFVELERELLTDGALIGLGASERDSLSQVRPSLPPSRPSQNTLKA